MMAEEAKAKLSKRVERIAPSPTLGLAQKVRMLRGDGHDVVDLSGGEPDFHSPPEAVSSTIEALKAGKTNYGPTRGLPELREALAKTILSERGLKIDPAREIIITPGAKQALAYAVLALIDDGDEVIIPDPGWVSFGPMVDLAGGRAVYPRTTAASDFSLSGSDLLRAAGPKAKILILTNPNNPTGTVLDEMALSALAEAVKARDLFVIADEIYSRIIFGDQKFVSLASLEGMAERTVTVDGFSKAFAMTGWRLGYAFGPAGIIDALDRVQQHTATCPTDFAQYGALAALAAGPDYTRGMVEAYRRRLERLADAATRLGLAFFEPRGAFYFWLDVRRLGRDSAEVSARLLDEVYLAAMPGSAFGAGGEGYLRLSLAVSDEDIDKAIDRLSGFVTEHG